MTEKPCIVRMQAIVDAQLEHHEQSVDNELRNNLLWVYGFPCRWAWCVEKSNNDHYFMLEESRRREAFDFEEIFEDDCHEEEGDGSNDDK